MAKDIDQQILNDLRQFDFVAQKIWPHVRGLFKRTIATRCSQCVISSRVPYITLTDVVCNLCHEHNKLRANDEETVWQQKYIEHQRKELDQLLKGHQGKGRDRYDALVLFSGGKDSLALVYLLRPHWDKLTLYHLDTGDLLPEVREIVDTVEEMVPSFVRVETDAVGWAKINGLPSDLLPTSSTMMGRVIDPDRPLLVDHGPDSLARIPINPSSRCSRTRAPVPGLERSGISAQVSE